MKKSLCTEKIPQNSENVKISKCPCPGNQNYVRRTDRPALANIQGEAGNQQYLKVDYGLKAGRSRSLSACFTQSTSLKPSPAPKQPPHAETSRKSQCPSFIQPPAVVTVRPKTIANKPRSQPLAAPKLTSNNCSSTNSAFHVNESAQSDSGYGDFLHPNSASSRSTTRSTTQSRSALSSTLHSSASSALQKSKSIENLSTRSSGSLIAKECSSSSSRRHESLQYPHHTFSTEVSHVTLPELTFYTLTQDTTAEGDSFISVLENVRLTSRDSSLLSEDDNTFVDGQQFFNEINHGKCSTTKTRPVATQYSLNVKRSNSTSETSNVGNSRMPAVKSTLKRRNTKKEIIFPLLYSPEYSEHIIRYCFSHKDTFIMNGDWVKMYVDKKARTNIVNWLIQIHGLIVPHFEPIHYMAVRLFDFAIIKLKLRKSHYQLAAIVSFWIALKYLDNTILLKVSKIYSLCNGKYSKEEILSMERNILKSINFRLNIADPLDFLHNYLKSHKLENNELLKHAAEFVLECTTLFETYSMNNAPFVAGSAVYLAYKVILKSNVVPIKFWGDRKIKSIRFYAESIAKHNVKYAIKEKYEPLNKYMTDKKLFVAKMFFNIF